MRANRNNMADYLAAKEFAAKQEAVKAGMKVIVAKSNHLLLDLDSNASVRKYNRNIGMVSHLHRVMHTSWWYSKSGAPARHVRIILADSLDAGSRVALETVLGSDVKRSMMNVEKIALGNEFPSILFKPGDAIVVSKAGAWLKIPIFIGPTQARWYRNKKFNGALANDESKGLL